MRRSRSLILAGLGLAVLVAPIHASDPMGVYCMVEKVVYEPADRPDRAQVWGACALANQSNGQYKQAARGYFYYSIPAGKEDVVRAEWADLKTAAGKDEAVGFGARWGSTTVGRFRPVGEAVAKPDVYPLNVGVVKLGKYGPIPDLLESLRAALGRK